MVAVVVVCCLRLVASEVGDSTTFDGDLASRFLFNVPDDISLFGSTILMLFVSFIFCETLSTVFNFALVVVVVELLFLSLSKVVCWP